MNDQVIPMKYFDQVMPMVYIEQSSVYSVREYHIETVSPIDISLLYKVQLIRGVKKAYLHKSCLLVTLFPDFIWDDGIESRIIDKIINMLSEDILVLFKDSALFCSGAIH